MKGRKEGREGGGKEIKEERKWKGRMKGKRGGGGRARRKAPVEMIRTPHIVGASMRTFIK